VKFKDYYRVIGVPPEATADEIKLAYRALARKFHPDVSKVAGAQQRFIEIGEANEVLKDPERRAAYDRLRAEGWKEGQEINAPQPARDRGQRGSAAGTDDGEGEHFSDFFESLFGRRSHGGRGGFERGSFQQRGQDIHFTLPVTLEESFQGGERQLKFQVPDAEFQGAATAAPRTITVKVAKGAIQGTTMRLRGQGHPGSSADLAGDLYLQVELVPHRWYQVDGRNLSLVVPITAWEAALGAQVAVPTLGGTVTATIPPGAQGGQKLRLKGRGLPGDHPGDPAGDQYLVLNLAVPTVVSDKAKDLYRELAKESNFSPRAAFAV
jgi:curved DNA-binding protein